MNSTQKRQVEAIRKFNRYYTNALGFLNRNYMDSEYSLVEVRVLFEISQKPDISSKEISQKLNIDPGYLSRIIKKLEADGLIERRPSETDGRTYLFSLTQAGKDYEDKLVADTNEQIFKLIEPLTSVQRKRLVEHVRAVEEIMCGLPLPIDPIMPY